MNAGTWLLIAFYTPLIASAQAAVNLDKIYGGKSFAENYPETAAFLQGFIPVLIVRIFFLILPYVLKFLAGHTRPPTRVAIDQRTVQMYSDSLIGMGLLGTFLSSIFFGSFSDIVERALDFNTLRDSLAENIPKVSTFYINYIIYAGLLGLATEISQIVTILFDLAGWSDHYEVYWFYYWPSTIYIFILVATYMVISPLIIVFGAIYYFLAYFTFAYQLIFVYKERDVEGRLFTIVYGRLHAGIIIGQICVILQFVLKENYLQAGLLLPAIYITQYNIRRYQDSFGKYFKFPSLKAASEYDNQAILDWVGNPTEYEHELLSQNTMFFEKSISMQDVEDVPSPNREDREGVNYPLIASGVQNEQIIDGRPIRAESTASLKD